MSSVLFWLLFIGIGIFVIWFYIKKVKHLKIGTFVFITGGVKTGKTLLSIKIALNKYQKNLLKYKIKKFLFPKKYKNLEMPLLYSNIPLKTKFVLLTEDLLLRKKRFAYGSVVLCDEASLVADSQLIKNMDINNRLLLFNKLIGHELKQGGCIIYNSQNTQDVHYSIKRCVSNYFYILHDYTIPFTHMLDIREMISSEENIVNTFNSDLDNYNKKYFISKRFYKKYDRYALSVLTDKLPVEKNVIDGSKLDNLKIDSIISFRPQFKDLGGSNEKGND